MALMDSFHLLHHNHMVGSKRSFTASFRGGTFFSTFHAQLQVFSSSSPPNWGRMGGWLAVMPVQRVCRA